MPRTRQPLEDRLRSYVRREIARREALAPITREERPGARSAFTKAIGRPTNFVSRYLTGRGHANLDTTIRIMAYFNLSWDQVRGRAPLPAPQAIPAPPMLSARLPRPVSKSDRAVAARPYTTLARTRRR